MISDGVNIHIGLDIEPWEVSELIDEVYPIIHKVVPNIRFEVNAYSTYEEECGGFSDHGVLTFNITKLTEDEITFIEKVIFENQFR